MSNISNKKIDSGPGRKKSHKSNYYMSNLINKNILPLPWSYWPKEGRFIMGLIAFWSISGIFILGSASWWVATREMGDGAYYIKRQLIWLLASWSIFYVAIKINLYIRKRFKKAINDIGITNSILTNIYDLTRKFFKQSRICIY